MNGCKPHFGSNSPLYGAKLQSNAWGMPGEGMGGFWNWLVHLTDHVTSPFMMLLAHSPLSRLCRSMSLLPVVTSTVLMVEDILVWQLVQSEEIFKTRPEWARFNQGHRRKRQKTHVTLTWKFPWKSCSSRHLPFLSSNSKILNAFLKTFSTKIKPTKCRAKEKNEARKAKKEGRSEKAESKS